MKKKILLVAIVALLASACDSQNQRSAVYAEKCKEALQKGLLATAELACYSAWFDVESAQLAPDIQSERLYELGRIMRQRRKYVEAEPLIRQALVIEIAVSGQTSAAYGRRLLELSLIKAGQAKWAEGGRILADVLDTVDQLPDRDRVAVTNVLKRYATRLQNTDPALATFFERKSVKLQGVVGAETDSRTAN